MVGAKVAPLFVNRDIIVRQLYDRLVQRMERFADVEAEPDPATETVIFRGRAPFMGVKPLQSVLRLSVLSTAPIESPRIRKCTRIAPGRFHNQIDIAGLYDLDDEVLAWVRTAYDLSEEDAAKQDRANPAPGA